MPHINNESRELTFKLVYYGPGMSGKTTNLVHAHRALGKERCSGMVTLDTAQERTLFFDFFAIDLGNVAGWALRFNMYTVPGQVYYEASRRLILDGADGIVFVADSQMARIEENLESWRSMEQSLRSYDVDPNQLPLVLQYNKRDCEDPIPIGFIEKALGLSKLPAHEAVAIKGEGVMETLREISRTMVQRFQM